MYLFDSHSKDENDNLSSSATAVLLKFDTLYSLENYIRSVYYNASSRTECFLKCSCWYNKYKYPENPGARIKYQIQKVPGIF